MGFIEGLTSLKVLHIPSSTLSSYGGSAPAVGGGNNSVQTSTALPSRGGNNVQTGGGGSADDGHLKDVSGILRQPDGAPGSSHQESAPLPVEGQPVSGDGRLMRRLVEWTRWRNEVWIISVEGGDGRKFGGRRNSKYRLSIVSLGCTFNSYLFIEALVLQLSL